MPKRSDDSCDYKGPEYFEDGLYIRFEVKDGQKYYVVDDIFVLVSSIDKLREDEWTYDSAQHNKRKGKVKS